MMYVETIRGYPYMPIEKLANEFSISTGTVRNRLVEVEQEIKAGRYSEYSVIRDGKIVLVNALVFIDYMRYRQQLLDKTARKYTPKFKPEELISCIGWSDKIIVEEEDNRTA